MKFLKKAVLWILATNGLLLVLVGGLIFHFMINPMPLLSSFAGLLIVMGLVAFFQSLARLLFDRPGTAMPVPTQDPR